MEKISIQCHAKNSVHEVMRGPNERQGILLVGGWGVGRDRKSSFRCATQEAKFELVGSLLRLLFVLDIYRRNVIRNQEKNEISAGLFLSFLQPF